MTIRIYAVRTVDGEGYIEACSRSCAQAVANVDHDGAKVSTAVQDVVDSNYCEGCSEDHDDCRCSRGGNPLYCECRDDGSVR